MDAKINKPNVDYRGISDPVVIGTSMGEVLVAWWDENTKSWNAPDRQSFTGGVVWFEPIKIPHGYYYDEALYGGEE